MQCAKLFNEDIFVNFILYRNKSALVLSVVYLLRRVYRLRDFINKKSFVSVLEIKGILYKKVQYRMEIGVIYTYLNHVRCFSPCNMYFCAYCLSKKWFYV